ncbi:hypothetical protein NBRC116188_09060 [Oceaniserpentilla sp. 4NH20-0058]|uniref:sulfite exporter TauE/SafE family protein n=1 Tax=Oceaniserpentilla sp. 4NH20-0058 TaxID=3127660 RepID=UPI0031025790
MEWLWVLFGVVIFLSFTIEAVTGFGSLVISLAIGVLFLPLEQIMPISAALNICMTSVIAFKNRQSLDNKLLLNVILPGMLLGTIVGFISKDGIDDALLKQLFGVLIIWFSTRELWRMTHQHQDKPRPIWLTRLLTVCAGITHGLFASGGPLLVYAVAGTNIDKARFRATMAFVWFSLNGFLTVVFFIEGQLQPLLIQVLWYLPLVVMAIYFGNLLHNKVNENTFRKTVYSLLFITGFILLISRYLS